MALKAPDTQTKRFATEEVCQYPVEGLIDCRQAPSGMLSRAGYTVRSRVTDDDGHVHAESASLSSETSSDRKGQLRVALHNQEGLGITIS